jgi:hypothetical protein
LLTIAGANFTLSEVVAKIKADPNSPWYREYLFYLLKIDGSGSTTFLTFADLLMNLAGYLMGEPKDDQQRLAVYRGPGPKGNCAMVLDPLLRRNIKTADIAAINSLMATGKVGNGVTNESAHNHRSGNRLCQGQFRLSQRVLHQWCRRPQSYKTQRKWKGNLLLLR